MKSAKQILWKGLLVVLLGVFLGVFIFAAYQLYYTFNGYRQATKKYNSLNEQYVSTQPEATPTPDVTEKPEETPEVFTAPITIDFDGLKERNKDIAGWIYCPDTPISYPVVRGADNDYYLYHSFDGDLNQSGTIFMDMVCEVDLSQDNTILYGHHMNNRGMFASLEDYRQEGYLEEHPIFYYLTPDETYVLPIFSMFLTGGDSDVYAFNFATDDEYTKFLESMTARSNYDTGIDVTSDDHIMTLSTCAYDYDDARYVVLCKIVPISEAGSILKPAQEKPAEATQTAEAPAENTSGEGTAAQITVAE
ncbi:MAG: class B sortase [Oscillospiraceae bacterium]|nr:class B sortase [Oscillospiraceae bacterium]